MPVLKQGVKIDEVVSLVYYATVVT